MPFDNSNLNVHTWIFITLSSGEERSGEAGDDSIFMFVLSCSFMAGGFCKTEALLSHVWVGEVTPATSESNWTNLPPRVQILKILGHTEYPLNYARSRELRLKRSWESYSLRFPLSGVSGGNIEQASCWSSYVGLISYLVFQILFRCRRSVGLTLTGR